MVEELAGPQAIAEQLGDEGALRVVLVLRDATGFEGMAGKVSAEHEGHVVGDLVPREAEEGLLGLEVADLKHAPDLVVQSGAVARHGQLDLAQGEILQALGVVEIG